MDHMRAFLIYAGQQTGPWFAKEAQIEGLDRSEIVQLAGRAIEENFLNGTKDNLIGRGEDDYDYLIRGLTRNGKNYLYQKY